MSIPYKTKVNDQNAVPVTNESHIIGIIGTTTYAPGLIRLVQVPQGPAPAVSISGYTEILSGTPSGAQFLVNYTTGTIAFSSLLDGTTVLVTSYQGLGSEIAAEDINEVQNPLSAIATQTITYNWPFAPSVTWSLAPNVVTNSSVSLTAGISLTKLQSLTPSIVPVTDPSGFIISSSTTATQLGFLDATSSIQTQLNAKQAFGSYITALTSDVSASGPGSASATVNSVGASSAANIHSAELAANAATNLNTVSTIVKRDASGNFSSGSITLTNQSAIVFQDTAGTPKSVTLEAPTTITSSYTLKWPLLQGASSTVLTNDGSGNLSWTAGGGGGGTPGGSTTQIQYNNAGTFAGSSNFTWDNSTSILTINGGSLIFTLPSPTAIQLNSLGSIDGCVTLTAQNVLVQNGNSVAPSYSFSSNTSTGMHFSSGNLAFSTSGIDALVINYLGSPTQIQSLQPFIINTTGSVPVDSSAILQADSTTKGFLPPRMTTMQRTSIASPTTGLMVYDTDNNQWMGWNGSSWAILG